MFGPDTPLVIDALQIAALAAAGGAAAVWLVVRKRKPQAEPPAEQSAGPLEERVRVLERIATDHPHDLDQQIEALRDTPETDKPVKEKT